jgi:hypothetical protein
MSLSAFSLANAIVGFGGEREIFTLGLFEFRTEVCKMDHTGRIDVHHVVINLSDDSLIRFHF